jgi:IMP dehydrogenase
MPPDEQARQVARVKRHLNWIIDNPVTVGPNQSIGDVRALVLQNGISGLPVIDDGVLVGIITSRDLRFAPDNNLLVRAVMTPESGRRGWRSLNRKRSGEVQRAQDREASPSSTSMAI